MHAVHHVLFSAADAKGLMIAGVVALIGLAVAFATRLSQPAQVPLQRGG